jgi:hypothetical protein
MGTSSKNAALAGPQANVTFTFSGGCMRGMPGLSACIKENARNSRYPAAPFASAD